MSFQEMNYNEIRLEHPFGCRVPTGPFDYGDEATVGLHLKRVGKNITNAGLKDFGVYLGHCPHDKWVVGIKDFVTCEIVDKEVFDTEDAMKEQWQLD